MKHIILLGKPSILMVVYIFPNQLNKTILFVGGGLETVPGIQLAKSKGLHVVVSDQNPNAPGMEIADDRILASTYNIEKYYNYIE